MLRWDAVHHCHAYDYDCAHEFQTLNYDHDYDHGYGCDYGFPNRDYESSWLCTVGRAGEPSRCDLYSVVRAYTTAENLCEF